MGEAKKREELCQYYLGLDFRECDSHTIEQAEKFFSKEYDRDVFIIAEENKICMEDEVCHGRRICRYKLQRDAELWLSDFDDDKDYDTKPYGNYWMDFMHETYRDEYVLLTMNGQLYPKAEEINEKVKDTLWERRNELLKNDPYKEGWNILEKEKHLNMLDEIAKELVLSELVYNKELYKPIITELNYDDLPF